VRIATSREEAELMIDELERQNNSPDLSQEQIDENNQEIEELKKWL